MRTTTYLTTPPPDDEEIACAVCGFGIRADLTKTTERTVITYTQHGSVYHHMDPTQVDVNVEWRIPGRTNCPLCGSNLWAGGGRRGSL